MDERQLQDIRRQLEEERDQAARGLEEYGASPDGDFIEIGDKEGFADSGHSTAERTEALGMIGKLRDRYRAAATALEKLDVGEDGRCERCGRAIPEERLLALPTATLCVECKQTAGAVR